MSDTIKLIIEIPKELYRACKEYADERSEDDALFLELIAIAHGIPLDDVKAEIQTEIDDNDTIPEAIDFNAGLKFALDILDNIGKTESEDT